MGMSDPGKERSGEAQQPTLLEAPPAPVSYPAGTTDRLPVAQVLLETPVPHLDRPFDYAVPSDLADRAVPGSRVKVRFAGRELTGWVLSRLDAPTTGSRLSPISKMVSALPVLAPEVLELCQQVALRCAGTASDVLRAGLPPRAARVEKEFLGLEPPPAELTPLQPRERTAELALKSYGDSGWQHRVLAAVEEVVEGGGDAVVVVPDQRDLEAAAGLLEDRLGEETIARLSAEMGPTPRYRSYLRLRFGQAKVAVGTRSAVYAPAARLRLIVMLDDDDPSHAEPRAPYQHTREVALLRAVQTGAGVMFLSSHRSLEVQRLVERGWLADRAPGRDVRRAAAPRVISTADDFEQERDPLARQARMPAAAYRAAREGLEKGPVLVQVGRAGFIPAVLCARCRSRQSCPSCHGPLSLPGHHAQSRTLQCRWCGLHHRDHRCGECGHAVFRAGVRGADRTAQELGRAFPGVPVISSSGDRAVDAVGGIPALVVSTPGVEPSAPDGYAAALLLDGDAQLHREGLDVPRRVLARWLRAASLVRPHGDGGTVVVTAGDQELTGALVRGDPVGYARRELYRRAELGLPPARRMLSLTAELHQGREFIDSLRLPEGLAWIGPSPEDDGRQRWLLFFSYAEAEAVVSEVRRVRRTSSAAPARGEQQHSVRVAVDDVGALQV